MKRAISQLKNDTFDIIVVGAGIHGACTARDAALRGLKVALIDKGDLCGATSHNSLKIIHGGIRYLQHLNFRRTLESINEQKYWLSTAPHLVKPVPFLMPTYGRGSRGSEAMWCGIKLYEALGIGRNKHIPTHRKIPCGKVISRDDCLQLTPNMPQDDLRGGAIWYDAQIEDPDRAVIQISQHADSLGASIANYVSANELTVENNAVTGVNVTDELNGESFTISGKLVINATGPWAGTWLNKNKAQLTQSHDLPLTKSMNIVTRKLFDEHAVGVNSTRQSDSIVGSTKRLYFITPWKNRSIIGTTHFHYDGKPGEAFNSLENTKVDIQEFVNEINSAYSGLDLSVDDVLYCYQGLTPANDPKQHPNATRLNHSKVVDHAKEDELNGLVSIISIKWTTARSVAKQAIDLCCKKLMNSQKSSTHNTSIPDTSAHFISESSNIKELESFAQHAIDQEMAVSFTDLILRRSDALMRSELSIDQMKTLFNYMAEQLNWSASDKKKQKQQLLNSWLEPKLHQELDARL